MKTKQKQKMKKHYFNVFLGIIIALVIFLGLNFLNVTINVWYFLFTRNFDFKNLHLFIQATLDGLMGNFDNHKKIV